MTQKLALLTYEIVGTNAIRYRPVDGIESCLESLAREGTPRYYSFYGRTHIEEDWMAYHAEIRNQEMSFNYSLVGQFHNANAFPSDKDFDDIIGDLNVIEHVKLEAIFDRINEVLAAYERGTPPRNQAFIRKSDHNSEIDALFGRDSA